MRDTNSPNLRSWIDTANDDACDFPIQNLPYGVFTRIGSSESARVGVAIGDQIFDLAKADAAGLFNNSPVDQTHMFADHSLNFFMSQGRPVWTAVRQRISELLDADCATIRDDASLRDALLWPIADAQLHLPMEIGDYTDFYASAHHASNVGRMFRPDAEPLLPNYKHMPVGYHGRASSVVISGTPIRRPMGQTLAVGAESPTFGPCRLLDYELEMGFVVGAGNKMGERVNIETWRDHLFGMVLLNDWSARDIQKWEYVPLGPFNAKNFASTISPWVVTFDALEPFAAGTPARDDSDPKNLDYLTPACDGFDVKLEVLIQSQQMRDKDSPPMRLSLGTLADMYWTSAQMLAHHTSTGCNMRPGDLLGSGTVSGPSEESRGCLLEKTWRGENPVALPSGEERKFLADGDTLIMRAWCEKPGARRIGFGQCTGVVLAAE